MTATGVRGTGPAVSEVERPARPRNNELEGLRGVAALAVLLTHVSLNSLGNRGPFGGLLARLDAGVAVFFVLSGYLLYRPFAAALLRDEPRPATRRYFRRRLVRIVPLYWLVVVAAFLFAPSDATVGATPGVTSVPLWTMARFVGFIQVYWKNSLAGPFPQAWTLATEMAFYLLLPVLAAVVARRPHASRQGRLRRQWMVLGGLALTAQLFRLAVVFLTAPYRGGSSISYTQLNAWLPNHLDLFAVGMAFAVITVERQDAGPGARIGHHLVRTLSRPGAAGMAWAVALGALLLAGYGLGLSRTDLSYGRVGEFTRHGAYLLAAAAAVAPLVFGRSGVGWVRRFLASRPLQFLGRISYGVYLWQELVLGRWISSPFATNGVIEPARHRGQQFDVAFWPALAWTVAVTVVLSTVTFYLVERPWMRRRDGRLGRFAGGLWAISLASFAMRIGTFGTVSAANPGGGEGLFHHLQANLLADGSGFAAPVRWVGEHRFDTLHHLLFTLWLVPSSMLGARSFLSHKTMAAVAGVAVVVAAGLLARRVAGDRAGLIAAALVAVAPDLWLIDGTLWPDGLFIALIGLALVVAYRWRSCASFRDAALIGVLIGAATMARGEAILLLPTLCVPLAWSRRRQVPRWSVHLAVIAAVTLGLLAPWAIGNLVLGDHPAPAAASVVHPIGAASAEPTPSLETRHDGARRAKLASDEGTRGAVVEQRNAELRNSASVQLPRGWARLGLLYGLLAVVPGLAGLAILSRRRRELAWPLVATLASVAVAAVLISGQVRGRPIGEFVLLVAAAVAVDTFLPHQRRQAAPRPDLPPS
jgi:peptidoglycan/LPS O-acetylase OafA/YrhL